MCVCVCALISFCRYGLFIEGEGGEDKGQWLVDNKQLLNYLVIVKPGRVPLLVSLSLLCLFSFYPLYSLSITHCTRRWSCA